MGLEHNSTQLSASQPNAAYQRFGNVQQLLDRGAATDQRGGLYGLPLSAAAFRGHTNVLHLLIERNAACVNLFDDMGRNALHLAARGGRVEAFEFLLSTGIDFNSVDVKGNTVLHYAASGGCLPIVKSLLDRGLKAGAASSGAWTPLHWAYRAAGRDVVGLLRTVYPDEQFVKTVQPAGLWSPLSVGVYHRNKMVGELSLTPSSPLSLQLQSVDINKSVISGEEADHNGGSYCNECYHVSLSGRRNHYDILTRSRTYTVHASTVSRA